MLKQENILDLQITIKGSSLNNNQLLFLEAAHNAGKFLQVMVLFFFKTGLLVSILDLKTIIPIALLFKDQHHSVAAIPNGSLFLQMVMVVLQQDLTEILRQMNFTLEF